MIVRAKAPVRVSFGGGGTDMEPYCADHGGAVVSTTISRYIYVSLYQKDLGSERTTVFALDLNQIDEFPAGKYEYDGKSDIIKAVLKNFAVKTPLDIYIHSDLPPGSGMGTSSSLIVALIVAVAKLMEKELTKYEIAYLAYKLEREELGQRGGYQDQFAAAFGGFNYITFDQEVRVHPLELSHQLLNEFRYRLLLVYTGKTHLSSEIQEEVMRGYEQHKISFLEGMAELVRVAKEMRAILSQNDPAKLNQFAQLLHEGWIAKKSLSEKITTNEVEQIYLLARKHGALGGKLLGAGGGGHVLLLIDPLKRKELLKIIAEIGGEVIPFEFEPEGAQIWTAEIEKR